MPFENSLIQSNLNSNIQGDGLTREIVMRMLHQSSGFFTETVYNANELEDLQNIIEMNRYSIRNVMDMVQNSCDDTFIKCRFEGQMTNCSDLFTAVTSQYGLCCTFNKNNLFK